MLKTSVVLIIFVETDFSFIIFFLLKERLERKQQLFEIENIC